MAKKLEQQTQDIREEARQEVQKELKVDGITPERKKKILGEWKEINIKLKEIELRNKKKEGYKHTFKRLEEFKQLNGKTVYSDAMSDMSQRDKDSLSLEMAYSQVEPMYRVVLEDMAKYVRSGVEKELLNKCKLDRGLIRDLTGIINVLKYIEIKDYTRAKTTFLYFQLGEDRIKDIEHYFNVNLGSLFKDDIKQVYETARELGISEKELAMNASTKMSSYSSQASDMERSIKGTDYTAEIVEAYAGGKFQAKPNNFKWTESNGAKATRLNNGFTKFLDSPEAKKAISGALLSATKITENTKYAASMEEFLGKPENANIRKKVENLDAVYTFTGELTRGLTYATFDERMIGTELAVELITKNDHVQENVYGLLRAKSKLEGRLEEALKNGNDNVKELEARIAEIDEEIAGILSGKKKANNFFIVSDEEKEISKRISELDREYKKLERSLKSEQDAEKKTEIETRLAEIKTEREELLKRRKPFVVNDYLVTSKKKAAAAVATQVLDNMMDKGRLTMTTAEISHESDMFVRTVRAGHMSKKEADKLIEDIGYGIVDPEKIDLLECVSTSYNNEYITQLQNEKSLDFLLSQINNPDENSRNKAICAVLNLINERLFSVSENTLGNKITKEELVVLENAFNEVKDIAAGISLGGINVQIIEDRLKSTRVKLEEKEGLISESENKFNFLQTEKAAEDYVQYIQNFYGSVVRLKRAFEVRYTLEEIDKLQTQFDACEALIAEKGIKGDESFENQRRAAKEKIEMLRQRTKTNIILDTSQVVKLKTREERVTALRSNLEFLVDLIKNGKLDKKDNLQIKELLIEYRKLRVLNCDLENGDRLEDIARMIDIVDKWSMDADLSKSKTVERVNEVRRLLTEMEQIVESGKFDENTLKKWEECKEKYDFLKYKLKVNRKILAEFDSAYAKVEGKIQENCVPAAQGQMVSIRNELKTQIEARNFERIKFLKQKFDRLNEMGFSGIDANVKEEIIALFEGAEKLTHTRSRAKNRSKEEELKIQLSSKLALIKTSLINIKDSLTKDGKESFDAQKFNNLVEEFQKIRNSEDGKVINESFYENVQTYIDEIQTIVKGNESEKESVASGSSETVTAKSGDKKGRFSPAGPVEPDGAIREVEESPLPEPEGMGISQELDTKGLTPEEIEAMQKK